MCRLAGRPEFVEKLIVTGGTPLQGEISIQGSKNAVLPILAACLLGEGPCELENCPEIKDVEDTLHILRKLGCQVNQSVLMPKRLPDMKLSAEKRQESVLLSCFWAHFLVK